MKNLLKLKGFPYKEATTLHKRLKKELKKFGYDAYQEKYKWSIFKHHVKNNPWYKSLIEKEFGDKPINDWNDVPILTKKHYGDDLSNLLSEGVREKDVLVSFTSGSSGNFFKFAKDKLSHALSWVLLEERIGWYGINVDDKEARFYGVPLQKSRYYFEMFKDRMMNRKRFPVFDLSPETLEKFLKTFKSTKFVYIYGYTHAIVAFAKYIESKGLRLIDICPTLKAVISTSEMRSPKDKEIIERVIGVPSVNEYGASECSIIGFENPKGQLQASEELLLLETVIDETGIEKLLVTSYFNTAFPLIRYEVGDRVSLERTQKNLIITDLHGRNNDVVELPSGKKLSAMSFYYFAQDMALRRNIMENFIVEQTAIDQFEFYVLEDDSFGKNQRLTKEDRSFLDEMLIQYLEPGIKVDIHYVKSFRKSSNGKIRQFKKTF